MLDPGQPLEYETGLFSYQINWELVTLWVYNLPIGRYMVKMRSQVKQVPP